MSKTRARDEIVAWGLLGASLLIRRTSHVEVRGPGAAHDGPAVYVHWHRHAFFSCVHHAEHGRWLLMSPADNVRPIARWCELLGLKLAMGTSGDQGHRALDELHAALGRGESVAMNIDGPSGPARVAKPGCVKLASRAEVPIIPMTFRARRPGTMRRRWDRLMLIAPFEHIVVEYGPPIDLAGKTPSEGLAEVERALSLLEG